MMASSHTKRHLTSNRWCRSNPQGDSIPHTCWLQSAYQIAYIDQDVENFNGYITDTDVKQCSHLGAHVIGPQMLQHSKHVTSKHSPLYTSLRGKLQTQTHSCTYVLREALFLTYKKKKKGITGTSIEQLANSIWYIDTMNQFSHEREGSTSAFYTSMFLKAERHIKDATEVQTVCVPWHLKCLR